MFGYVDGMSYNLVENGGNLNDISNITYIYYPTLFKFLLSPIADMVPLLTKSGVCTKLWKK